VGPGEADRGPGRVRAAESDERAALRAALATLGPRQRAVIVLRYWMDMSEAEIAAALNCSRGTVKSQAARALATLKKATVMEGEVR
jgi:RNA polymerase sigma factor (sigma-70 family)